MSSSIAPTFLVASPALTCPFFNHSLVVLVEHDPEGSFGFIVNQPSEIAVERVLGELQVPVTDAAEDLLVLAGGPVAPETGWILFERDPEHLPENTVPVGDALGLTASLEFLRELTSGEGPSRALFMLGYSGWAPGQLEAELREGSWLPVDLSSDLLFETPAPDKWRAALRELGVDPAWVVGRTAPSA